MLNMKANRRQMAMAMGIALFGLPAARVLAATLPANVRAPLPFRVAPALGYAAELAPASAVRLGGWLGARVDANAAARLLAVDTAPLLAGFQHKPGSHPWIGEHVGKWMHAASLAWANSGNSALRTKLDSVVRDLIAAQESDGYLGTYLPEDRFAMHEGAEWDVWSHKYGLLGLLTYHRYTGHEGALAASRKIGDLLIATFPAQRSINAAGHHQGMAATSVLEPIVLLYRMTADPRYLAFARYIVGAWDEEGGAHIVRTLLNEGKVRAVGNGKAYEMLSNIVGMCDLARVTGDQALIDASLAAWSDIVATQRFATGTTSRWEYFQRDHDLRGDVMAHVGETCVTTTWIQLNLSLLQLTGEARFGDELERSWYNHLSAAQHPDGNDWCYFTALEGRKHYDQGITCCHSSGPRGMALAPIAAYLVNRTAENDVLLVNSFETSTATLDLGEQSVRIEQISNFPHQGRGTLRLHMARPARFAIKVRVPEWAQPMTIAGAVIRDGWAELPAKRWRDGDGVTISYALGPRVIAGEHDLEGRAACAYGPFILAYDADANHALGAPYLLRLGGEAQHQQMMGDAPLGFAAPLRVGEAAAPQPATLRTFADAGAGGGIIRVWLRSPGAVGAPPHESLLLGGVESRSRSGTLNGSINDEDYETLVATNDGTLRDEDWFAITMDHAVRARRFHFMHGRNFHDGGWFDTSGGKPQLQVQHSAGGAWQTIGTFDRYPATTASNAGMLLQPWMGYEFELTLDVPHSFVAVRVIGKPASGDNAAQSFATCTQLQAFTA